MDRSGLSLNGVPILIFAKMASISPMKS